MQAGRGSLTARPLAGPAEPLAEPRIHPDLSLVELPEQPEECGAGQLCHECRDEIRREALRWIRELNAAAPAPERPQTSGETWYRTWHSELLLGNA
jgi:hypothetical protein